MCKLTEKYEHPNIIKYFTSFMENDHLHILMEYAIYGDMYKALKDQRAKKKYIAEKDLWDYSYQILRAVQYLHKVGVIHRDIKCLNIFLSENKVIKLGDMGVSKF